MRAMLLLPVLLLSVSASAENSHSVIDHSPAILLSGFVERAGSSVVDRSPMLRLEGLPKSKLPQALDRSPILRKGDEITDPSATAVCRDRIEKAREERGLPKLRGDKASPDEPLFIAAVDKRIGGCSVLVMRNNLSDIRPLSKFRDAPVRLTPLKAQ
jgi:hypothetical protein